ncbi:MAG: ATP synthase subunit alpha [candidate division TM6 bacterium GW2011_GWF2_43_17]|nr:MAG: ATP synthase subunit alpha [candidate division TM6 bacterium GW2011_GWF2_43_17]HAU30174.1 F0F1 ATP synthase subunit alpha [Candidatus Dependentiae bacterium]
MEIKNTDLISLFERSLREIQGQTVEKGLRESGTVIQVGDSSCKIIGLQGAVFGELLTFAGGNKGIVLDLKEDSVTAFVLYSHIPVSEQEIVERTGDVFRVPVSKALLGRTINATGKPIDGLGDFPTDELRPIEVRIPGIVDRTPINKPLETGIMAIDALVPVGRGQRELIVGNRGTGKTAVALDTIIHQKGKNVICVYASIGQRQANIARMIRTLEEQGAMEYTIIVDADAGSSALNRYLAPYVATTVGEFFVAHGHDVLVVYDDLSNHATAYREISLLMRRPPGREAYPGDVFYLHSRLLERAGHFKSGGSLTALPIVQIQGDDITAYIPTNLISITDGQIFLDTKLFNSGVRPAVNVELSVSRVGGAAQTKAIKSVTRALRLELAQYAELLAFSQFGSELDMISQQRLARGAVVVELLKQAQFETSSFVDQALKLFLLREDFLDRIDLREVSRCAREFVSYVAGVYKDVYARIYQTEELQQSLQLQLRDIAREFMMIFSGREGSW